MLIPIILLFDSGAAIVRACDVSKAEKSESVASGVNAYNLIAASLTAYMLLIPMVLLGAAMRG